MHFSVWTGSLSHVRRNGGKKQEYDIMSKLGEVTKKKSLSMSKTKIKKNEIRVALKGEDWHFLDYFSNNLLQVWHVFL